jgi:hypothetical protein
VRRGSWRNQQGSSERLCGGDDDVKYTVETTESSKEETYSMSIDPDEGSVGVGLEGTADSSHRLYDPYKDQYSLPRE